MGKRVIIILLILVVVFICVKFGAAFLTKRALQKETINQVNISKKSDNRCVSRTDRSHFQRSY